jgi:hypothetical protein
MWIVGWVFLSLVVAWIGDDKKIGMWGALFISLIFSPVIGLLVTYMSGDKVYATAKTDKPIESPTKSVEERLFDLNEMKEQGLLSEEEYLKQRERIIGSI